MVLPDFVGIFDTDRHDMDDNDSFRDLHEVRDALHDIHRIHKEMVMIPQRATEEALQVSQTLANHMVCGQMSLGTVPVQLAGPNPNRISFAVTKSGANFVWIAETQANAATGFLILSNDFLIPYTGAIWAVASAAATPVSWAELVRTQQ